MPLVKLTTVAELPGPDEAKEFPCGDKTICVANVNGEISAMDNICLHRGGPLCDGPINGTVVTCPWHGWQYELKTGTLIQDPIVGVSRHETRIVGDEVQVQLTD